MIENPQKYKFDISTGSCNYYHDPEIYDHEFKSYREDKRFYLNMGRSVGGPIMEIGCGTGRLMYHWVKNNLEVDGFDFNSSMLDRAQKKLATLGKEKKSLYNFIQGDMKDFRLKNKYNLIVCAFNTMMHLYNYEELDNFLENIRLHLQFQGTFVFDILNPDFRWLMRDPEKRHGKTRFKHPHHKCWYYYTTSNYYDPEEQIAYLHIYHDPIDEKDFPSYEYKLAHRIYYPQEIKAALVRAGFKEEALFGNFTGSELQLYSPSQVYITSL
ncbi:MAG: class I SAM-dependent methyltransferase [Myxococcota bacterium]